VHVLGGRGVLLVQGLEPLVTKTGRGEVAMAGQERENGERRGKREGAWQCHGRHDHVLIFQKFEQIPK
jgi:hypothetical protein